MEQKFKSECQQLNTALLLHESAKLCTAQKRNEAKAKIEIVHFWDQKKKVLLSRHRFCIWSFDSLMTKEGELKHPSDVEHMQSAHTHSRVGRAELNRCPELEFETCSERTRCISYGCTFSTRTIAFLVSSFLQSFNFIRQISDPSSEVCVEFCPWLSDN